MEWLTHVAGARRGDAEARRELRDFLLPFVHGVLLGHLPHSQADGLLTSVLDEALGLLPTAPADEAVGRLVLSVARRRATLQAVQPEAAAGRAPVDTARARLGALQQLPEPLPELLAMRLVEGISGPELASVAQQAASDIRGGLERGAAALVRAALGTSVSLSGDPYLWDLSGVPNASVARLETELTLLRFNPDATDDASNALTPPAGAPAQTTGERTMQDLKPVSGPPSWHRDEPTAVEKSNPNLGPNPFTADPATVHAADLPAAALGAPLPPTAASPARQPPARRPSVDQEEILTTEAPLSLFEEETSAQKPPALTRSQPLGQPLDRTGQTRAQLPPALSRSQPMAVPLDSNDETRAQLPPALSRSQPVARPLTDPEDRPAASSSAQYFDHAPIADLPEWNMRGPLPLVLVGLLIVCAAATGWFGLELSEKQAKSSWNLVEVVVAAHEMEQGAQVAFDDVATRAVPPILSASAVTPDRLNLIIDQRLAFPVQEGDPLHFDHFAFTRSTELLSKSIQKRARVVTIATNTVASVGRHVMPGDVVDVLLAISPPNMNSPEDATRRPAGQDVAPVLVRAPVRQWRARTLMERVQVVATGKLSQLTSERMLGSRAKDWQSVSFLVMPEEAEVLVLAQSVGKVQLTLRNSDSDPDDLNKVERIATIGTLLTGIHEQLSQKKRAATIGVIRHKKR